MKLTLAQWMEKEGVKSLDEILTQYDLLDSVQPALCSEGCEVEPDGTCPHGGVALTMALGVI